MAPHRWALRALLISLLLLSVLGQPRASPAIEASPPADGGARPLIRVEEGVVTVKIADAPLEEVLKEISAQSRIRLVLHGSRPELLSVAFQAVPLDEALRRLITANFLLLYSSDGDLAEVWVWRRAPEARGLARQREPLESPIEALAGGAVAQRRQAVLALGESPHAQVVEPLIEALEEDEAPEVRQAAVVALEKLEGPKAMAALAAAASDDSDQVVRLSAVKAMAQRGGPEAIEPLTLALLGDAEPSVRYEALVSLPEFGDDHVEASLLEALDDSEAFIRDKAAEILQRRSPVGREP